MLTFRLKKIVNPLSKSSLPIRLVVERAKTGSKFKIRGDIKMRVMVIIKANKESEAGIMPSEQLLNAMGKFNDELINAGVMLAGEGLHPSSKAKRIKFSRGERLITDGPFAETRELIAGYWIWKVNSMDEALEWAKRIPNDPERPDMEGEIEIRPIFEISDFGAELTPELEKLKERILTKEERLKQS
jgi:hypothetical protein